MITSKQRAYLRSLANKVPALYQVGKDGVNENMIELINNALEARELIKVHVLDNAFMSAREASDQLADATNSDVVQVIGNKFVLYKESKENKKIEL
ncbi:MAG: ribosome assembly RNA-binding protein YhbY [Clostridiales bacterium]|nr:ribosome assembly RNA-binding protein YhbY [Clostridiales bacterium]